jgi:hypothetical protein
VDSPEPSQSHRHASDRAGARPGNAQPVGQAVGHAEAIAGIAVRAELGEPGSPKAEWRRVVQAVQALAYQFGQAPCSANRPRSADGGPADSPRNTPTHG